MRLRDKRWIVPGVAGVVVGALIAALGFWLWPDPPASEGPEPGELKILSGADDSVGQWRKTLVDMWNADHPNNRAVITELTQTANGQRSQMIAGAEAHPDVDIYNLDVTLVAEFAARPYIRPIDQSRLPPKFLDGFLAKPLETCRYKDPDTLWALPLNTDAGLLFYRDDLMPDPPPTQWDQLVSVARQVPASKSMAAYVGQLGNYEGLTVNALEAIWAEGGEVVDAAGKVVATRETFSKGVRRLIANPGETRAIIHPRAGEFDETASREAFAMGEALFMRNWPVQYSTLLNNDAAEVSKPKRIPFKVTALPGPSVLGGQNLAIAAASKKPRAAQALIEFMTQESSQLLLAKYGGFAATRKAPYHDPAISQQLPYIPTLEKAIEKAKLRPATPYYARFSDTFRDVVTSAMGNGGDPPADFADRLTKSLQGR